ncbi:hypothetical protein BKA65DRAFT_489913 [Rhexocercosporidium sp. MPI-PUGE-AT-0058]|nr:hypothetical protein BKA65DRAFT_489913 [Rhexocercosporidium sp. MPI-PUGE-AT-0058]
MSLSDPESSPRRSELRPAGKRQKTGLPDFNEPTALVTFVVGPNSTEFLIHKEVVCLYSDILRAAFNGNFTEGRTQTYRLEDTSEAAFRLFMQWLYCQKFTVLQTTPDDTNSLDGATEQAEDMALVELWILADKFGMPHLQNAAINSMQAICVDSIGLPVGTFRYLYENTGEDSLLRKYMVKLCVVSGFKGLFRRYSGFFPQEMLVDIAEEFTAEFRDADGAGIDIEDFYVST